MVFAIEPSNDIRLYVDNAILTAAAAANRDHRNQLLISLLLVQRLCWGGKVKFRIFGQRSGTLIENPDPSLISGPKPLCVGSSANPFRHALLK